MTYANWLTKEQIAKSAGCSLKTVERAASGGKIQRRLRPRPDGLGVGEAVYHPDDVGRWIESRAAGNGPFVLAPAPEAGNGKEVAPPAKGREAAFAELLGEAIARALSAVRPSDAVFTTGEAALYSKRSKTRLAVLRREGKLPNAGTPGRVLYRRVDLDSL